MDTASEDRGSDDVACNVPQAVSTASEGAQSSSPSGGNGPSLLEVIDGLFSIEHLRKDEELLALMNGRMLVSAQALSKHSKMVSTHPTVTAEDIVVCGRSTKKFVLEELPQGSFSLGPLIQAHQKSRCTVSLRLGANTTDAPTQRPLREIIPSRAAAQSLLFHDAPQPRILHYYWCPTARLILLTFENDAIAKQAFLDLQSKKIPNAPGIEARIRIDNQNAVFYSNQGAAINAPAVKPRVPAERSTTATPFAAVPNIGGSVPNFGGMPPMVPPQFGMLGFPFSPFLFPPFMAPLMAPQGPQPNRFPAQPPQRKPFGGAVDHRGKSEDVEGDAKSNERKPPAVADVKIVNPATDGARSSPALLAVQDLPSDRSMSFIAPLTPATPATPDSLSTPSVGTKYRLDPYSRGGRVVQEERASPTTESLDSPPKAIVAAPPTIDFCLPQPRSVANGGAPLLPKPRGNVGRLPEPAALSAAQFPTLDEPKAAKGPLPNGVACVDQKSPTVNSVAVKASYASILLGASRSEQTAA